MSETILVVEDEQDISELIRFNLDVAGFEVACSFSGEEALKSISQAMPSLVILDLMLPGIDGLSVCRQVRANPRTQNLPIIMVSAKGEEDDVVKGLELGADDYISKPFSPKILLARVQSVIRRKGKQTERPQPTGEVIQHDRLEIHLGRRLVQVDGSTIDLTKTEFDLLSFLASRPGWVFTRNQIVNAVQGDNHAVTERSVDVQVVGLRRKLADLGSWIETVRGVGYRFKDSSHS